MERVTRILAVFSLAAAVAFLSFPSSALGGSYRLARRLRRRGNDVETWTGIDVVDRGDIPFAFDSIGHAILWCAVGLVALALARTTGFGGNGAHRSVVRWGDDGRIVVWLVLLSGLVEVGQGVFTANRNAEFRDLAANAVGVVLAWVLVVAARIVRRGRPTGRALVAGS